MRASARTPAIIATVVALLIALQYALSFVPGVELVTVTFVAFSCVFGCKRAVITATAFSLLRQLVFGFYPPVLVLYLVYFNLLGLIVGAIGARFAGSPRLGLMVAVSAVSTLCFTLLDNVITPLWLGYSANTFWLYFKASLPFALIQTACAVVSTAALFKPLVKVFGKFAN